MSFFNIGGNAGVALGPIVLTPLVLWLGLEGGVLAALPVFAVALMLLRALPALGLLAPTGAGHRERSGEDDVRAMCVLSVVNVFRGVAWFTLLTFVPLWVVARGGSERLQPFGTGQRALGRRSGSAPGRRV